MKKCKICSTETERGFNINFKLIPICEKCAKAILIQQAQYYNQQPF